LLAIIPAIGQRVGLGMLLAEGSRGAAAQIGGEAEQLAMHVKGMELPGYEPRSLKTMALGLAVSSRGACHNRSGAYEADFSGQVDRFQADPQRGVLVAASEDFAAILDSLIVCKFLRRCFTDFYSEGAELLSKVTSWSFTAAELRQIGERINTLKKLFNLREGWQLQDDWLPPRLLSEPLPTGVARGIGLSPVELRMMIEGYYNARGWDKEGYVPEEKRKELNL
jgi:aldehyde:ferredoxin oxidoreductase